MERDNFMTPEQAKNFGLIDKIIKSRSSIEPEDETANKKSVTKSPTKKVKK